MGLLQRIRDAFDADKMSTADERRWAACASMADACELMAQWLEGRIKGRPGYCGSVDVDEDDAPGLTGTLIALNRAGFLTDNSQAGIIRDGWMQRAWVCGYASERTAKWLGAAVAHTGILVITRTPRKPWRRGDSLPVTVRDLGGGRFQPFTQVHNKALPASHIADDWTGFGICQEAAVREIVAAVQVDIVDPEWGRNDILWPRLRKAAQRHGRAA